MESDRIEMALKLILLTRLSQIKRFFFAPNGTGKTFLSRAFRTVETVSDVKKHNDFLSIGKDEGTFSFKLKTIADEKEIKIIIKRDHRLFYLQL